MPDIQNVDGRPVVVDHFVGAHASIYALQLMHNSREDKLDAFPTDAPAKKRSVFVSAHNAKSVCMRASNQAFRQPVAGAGTDDAPVAKATATLNVATTGRYKVTNTDWLKACKPDAEHWKRVLLSRLEVAQDYAKTLRGSARDIVLFNVAYLEVCLITASKWSVCCDGTFNEFTSDEVRILHHRHEFLSVACSTRRRLRGTDSSDVLTPMLDGVVKAMGNILRLSAFANVATVGGGVKIATLFDNEGLGDPKNQKLGEHAVWIAYCLRSEEIIGHCTATGCESISGIDTMKGIVQALAGANKEFNKTFGLNLKGATKDALTQQKKNEQGIDKRIYDISKAFVKANPMGKHATIHAWLRTAFSSKQFGIQKTKVTGLVATPVAGTFTEDYPKIAQPTWSVRSDLMTHGQPRIHKENVSGAWTPHWRQLLRLMSDRSGLALQILGGAGAGAFDCARMKHSHTFDVDALMREAHRECNVALRRLNTELALLKIAKLGVSMKRDHPSMAGDIAMDWCVWARYAMILRSHPAKLKQAAKRPAQLTYDARTSCLYDKGGPIHVGLTPHRHPMNGLVQSKVGFANGVLGSYLTTAIPSKLTTVDDAVSGLVDRSVTQKSVMHSTIVHVDPGKGHPLFGGLIEMPPGIQKKVKDAPAVVMTLVVDPLTSECYAWDYVWLPNAGWQHMTVYVYSDDRSTLLSRSAAVDPDVIVVIPMALVAPDTPTDLTGVQCAVGYSLRGVEHTCVAVRCIRRGENTVLWGVTPLTRQTMAANITTVSSYHLMCNAVDMPPVAKKFHADVVGTSSVGVEDSAIDTTNVLATALTDELKKFEPMPTAAATALVGGFMTEKDRVMNIGMPLKALKPSEVWLENLHNLVGYFTGKSDIFDYDMGPGDPFTEETFERGSKCVCAEAVLPEFNGNAETRCTKLGSPSSIDVGEEGCPITVRQGYVSSDTVRDPTAEDIACVIGHWMYCGSPAMWIAGNTLFVCVDKDEPEILHIDMRAGACNPVGGKWTAKVLIDCERDYVKRTLKRCEKVANYDTACEHIHVHPWRLKVCGLHKPLDGTVEVHMEMPREMIYADDPLYQHVETDDETAKRIARFMSMRTSRTMLQIASTEWDKLAFPSSTSFGGLCVDSLPSGRMYYTAALTLNKIDREASFVDWGSVDIVYADRSIQREDTSVQLLLSCVQQELVGLWRHIGGSDYDNLDSLANVILREATKDKVIDDVVDYLGTAVADNISLPKFERDRREEHRMQLPDKVRIIIDNAFNRVPNCDADNPYNPSSGIDQWIQWATNVHMSMPFVATRDDAIDMLIEGMDEIVGSVMSGVVKTQTASARDVIGEFTRLSAQMAQQTTNAVVGDGDGDGAGAGIDLDVAIESFNIHPDGETMNFGRACTYAGIMITTQFFGNYLEHHHFHGLESIMSELWKRTQSAVSQWVRSQVFRIHNTAARILAVGVVRDVICAHLPRAGRLAQFCIYGAERLYQRSIDSSGDDSMETAADVSTETTLLRRLKRKFPAWVEFVKEWVERRHVVIEHLVGAQVTPVNQFVHHVVEETDDREDGEGDDQSDDERDVDVDSCACCTMRGNTRRCQVCQRNWHLTCDGRGELDETGKWTCRSCLTSHNQDYRRFDAELSVGERELATAKVLCPTNLFSTIQTWQKKNKGGTSPWTTDVLESAERVKVATTALRALKRKQTQLLGDKRESFQAWRKTAHVVARRVAYTFAHARATNGDISSFHWVFTSDQRKHMTAVVRACSILVNTCLVDSITRIVARDKYKSAFTDSVVKAASRVTTPSLKKRQAKDKRQAHVIIRPDWRNKIEIIARMLIERRGSVTALGCSIDDANALADATEHVEFIWYHMVRMSVVYMQAKCCEDMTQHQPRVAEIERAVRQALCPDLPAVAGITKQEMGDVKPKLDTLAQAARTCYSGRRSHDKSTRAIHTDLLRFAISAHHSVARVQADCGVDTLHEVRVHHEAARKSTVALSEIVEWAESASEELETDPPYSHLELKHGDARVVITRDAVYVQRGQTVVKRRLKPGVLDVIRREQHPFRLKRHRYVIRVRTGRVEVSTDAQTVEATTEAGESSTYHMTECSSKQVVYTGESGTFKITETPLHTVREHSEASAFIILDAGSEGEQFYGLQFERDGVSVLACEQTLNQPSVLALVIAAWRSVPQSTPMSVRVSKDGWNGSQFVHTPTKYIRGTTCGMASIWYAVDTSHAVVDAGEHEFHAWFPALDYEVVHSPSLDIPDHVRDPKFGRCFKDANTRRHISQVLASLDPEAEFGAAVYGSKYVALEKPGIHSRDWPSLVAFLDSITARDLMLAHVLRQVVGESQKARQSTLLANAVGVKYSPDSQPTAQLRPFGVATPFTNNANVLVPMITGRVLGDVIKAFGAGIGSQQMLALELVQAAALWNSYGLDSTKRRAAQDLCSRAKSQLTKYPQYNYIDDRKRQVEQFSALLRRAVEKGIKVRDECKGTSWVNPWHPRVEGGPVIVPVIAGTESIVQKLALAQLLRMRSMCLTVFEMMCKSEKAQSMESFIESFPVLQFDRARRAAASSTGWEKTRAELMTFCLELKGCNLSKGVHSSQRGVMVDALRIAFLCGSLTDIDFHIIRALCAIVAYHVCGVSRVHNRSGVRRSRVLALRYHQDVNARHAATVNSCRGEVFDEHQTKLTTDGRRKVKTDGIDRDMTSWINVLKKHEKARDDEMWMSGLEQFLGSDHSVCHFLLEHSGREGYAVGIRDAIDATAVVGSCPSKMIMQFVLGCYQTADIDIPSATRAAFGRLANAIGTATAVSVDTLHALPLPVETTAEYVPVLVTHERGWRPCGDQSKTVEELNKSSMSDAESVDGDSDNASESDSSMTLVFDFGQSEPAWLFNKMTCCDLMYVAAPLMEGDVKCDRNSDQIYDVFNTAVALYHHQLQSFKHLFVERESTGTGVDFLIYGDERKRIDRKHNPDMDKMVQFTRPRLSQSIQDKLRRTPWDTADALRTLARQCASDSPVEADRVPKFQEVFRRLCLWIRRIETGSAVVHRKASAVANTYNAYGSERASPAQTVAVREFLDCTDNKPIEMQLLMTEHIDNLLLGSSKPKHLEGGRGIRIGADEDVEEAYARQRARRLEVIKANRKED